MRMRIVVLSAGTHRKRALVITAEWIEGDMSYINDFDGYEGMHGHRYAPSSGFPEANLDEPDDSEDVYYDTYAELEAACARNKEFAARWNADQAKRKAERLAVEELELVGESR
jgi:hypothetical protein